MTGRRTREPWMKTSAVAHQCGVTYWTVLAWVKAGKLPAKRTPGGHYRFRPADVDALLKDDDEDTGPSSTTEEEVAV